LHLRYVPGMATPDALAAAATPPFQVLGAPNVILETIKRGEDDDFDHFSGSSTVVLRLYEAFGGHAQAKLRLSKRLEVSSVYLTNLLEDEGEKLSCVETKEGDIECLIPFHGFQVHTIKVVLSPNSTKRSARRDSWVNVDVRKYL